VLFLSVFSSTLLSRCCLLFVVVCSWLECQREEKGKKESWYVPSMNCAAVFRFYVFLFSQSLLFPWIFFFWFLIPSVQFLKGKKKCKQQPGRPLRCSVVVVGSGTIFEWGQLFFLWSIFDLVKRNTAIRDFQEKKGGRKETSRRRSCKISDFVCSRCYLIVFFLWGGKTTWNLNCRFLGENPLEGLVLLFLCVS